MKAFYSDLQVSHSSWCYSAEKIIHKSSTQKMLKCPKDVRIHKRFLPRFLYKLKSLPCYQTTKYSFCDKVCDVIKKRLFLWVVSVVNVFTYFVYATVQNKGRVLNIKYSLSAWHKNQDQWSDDLLNIEWKLSVCSHWWDWKKGGEGVRTGDRGERDSEEMSRVKSEGGQDEFLVIIWK